MKIEMYQTNGPIESSRIQQLEDKLSIKLPTQYRGFLQKYNGGTPEPDVFALQDGSDRSMLDQFLGLDVGEYDNLEKYWVTYKERIPHNMFPIAHDPGSNLVIIAINGNELGKVYFWDHEYEADEGEVADMSNVHLIANSFQEFLDGLME